MKFAKIMSPVLRLSAVLRRAFLFSCEVNAYFTANISKLSTKKSFKEKNTFTFQNEFRRQFDAENLLQGRIVSSELILNQDSSPKKCSDFKHSFRKTKNTFTPPLTYRGEILFGIHPVHLALLQKKRSLYRLYIRKDKDSMTEHVSDHKEKIIALAETLNVPISFVDNRGLKILAPGAVHQGICLDAGFLPLTSWNGDNYEYQTSEKLPLWLVLDEILDPMNVGAIIRSAYYFGVDKVFTIKGNSCKLSPTVSKASSGALEVIDLYELENLEEFIKGRKHNNWSVVSTLAYAENKVEHCILPISVSDFIISKPTILILGNEGRGISEGIKELCDTFVSIDPGQCLHQGVDSLNVSVAAGVLLYVINSKNFRR